MTTGTRTPTNVTSINLRRATRQDARALIELIMALADFEKLTPPDAEEQKRLISQRQQTTHN
jgi:hypothetical protein